MSSIPPTGRPSRPRRRWWRFVLVAAALWWLAGLVGALLATRGRAVAVPAQAEIAGRPAESVSARTGDGLNVCAWLVRASEGQPAVRSSGGRDPRQPHGAHFARRVVSGARLVHSARRSARHGRERCRSHLDGLVRSARSARVANVPAVARVCEDRRARSIAWCCRHRLQRWRLGVRCARVVLRRHGRSTRRAVALGAVAAAGAMAVAPVQRVVVRCRHRSVATRRTCGAPARTRTVPLR
jgi:hypothetical protein